MATIPVMLRWLFNTSAAVSLLLCVASVVMWVRSYTYTEGLYGEGPGGRTTIGYEGGRVFIEHVTSGPQHTTWEFFSLDRGRPSALDLAEQKADRQLGFAVYTIGVPPFQFHIIVFPIWSECLLTAALPSYWLLTYRKHRRHRLKRNICPACGYDLRGSAGACPECGALPSAKQ